MGSQEMHREYANLVLWGPFVSVTDAELDRVEKKIKHALPSEYREFLKKANGGGLEYAVSLPPGDEGEPISFKELVSADRLAARWKTHRKQSKMTGFPTGLLPVADDGGGSELYLDLRPETHGQVLAFAHGLPEWAGGDSQDSMGVVADTWDGYLSRLVLDEDVAEMTWDDVARADDDAEDAAWRDAVVAWLDSGLPDWRQRDWAS